MSKKFTVGQPLASGQNIKLCIFKIFLWWHGKCFNVAASAPIVKRAQDRRDGISQTSKRADLRRSIKMKLKSLAVTIVAGGLFAAAGPCFAALCSTLATLGAWQASGPCTDPDGDSTWAFVGATVPLTTTFVLTEVPFAGGDVYNVAFAFVPPLGTAAVGQTISFTATGSVAEPFEAANYDTTVTEPLGGSGAISTARITGLSGPVNLLLTSNDGSHAPFPSGETAITNNITIAATDTFTAIPTGIVFNSANNSFQTGSLRAPEPISLALVGVALAGMGLVRRKRKLT